MKKCKEDCKYYSENIEGFIGMHCKKLLTEKERCIKSFTEVIIKDYYKKK